MILLIDNYDSFTYNIYQYLLKLGYDTSVVRNDDKSTDEIIEMNPSHIMISPGPGRPEDAGVSVEVVKKFAGKTPILGICLGHQCIGYAFGGDIVKADKLYHGKTSEIMHDRKGLFTGLKNPLIETRYHSLVIKEDTLPDVLEVTAMSEDSEVMGIRHVEHDIHGVQFHPESISSEEGLKMLENFFIEDKHDGMLKEYLAVLANGRSLEEEEAEYVMEEITEGRVKDSQISSILTALRIKGETIDEITGFARVMRRKSITVGKPKGIKVIDTCGTGGDSSGTFNISTAAAFISAGAGLTVAKHGNRSVTSKCGSADVLERLGIETDVGPDVMEKALEKTSISFLFAPKLHHSIRYAMEVRWDIGIKTIFNILGPLTNPAEADYQLIGVFKKDYVEKMAIALSRLGSKRAMVVHGSDGLDEVTITGRTHVCEVKDGWIRSYDIHPTDFGLSVCDPRDIKGGSVSENASIILDILSGEKGYRRDVAVINSACAIYISGKAETFYEAARMAENSIDSGAALRKLEQLREITNRGN